MNSSMTCLANRSTEESEADFDELPEEEGGGNIESLCL